LRNLLHFLELRSSADAQPEIKWYADVISNMISKIVPNVWEAFNDFTLNKIELTGPEIELLNQLNFKLMLGQIEHPRMTAREITEFKEKIGKIFN